MRVVVIANARLGQENLASQRAVSFRAILTPLELRRSYGFQLVHVAGRLPVS